MSTAFTSMAFTVGPKLVSSRRRLLSSNYYHNKYNNQIACWVDGQNLYPYVVARRIAENSKHSDETR